MIGSFKENINKVYIGSILLASLLPKFNSIDNIGIRFLVLSVLTSIFILYRTITNNFLFNKSYLLIFLILSSLGIYSAFVSLNFSESILITSQFISMIITFYCVVNAYKDIKNPIKFISILFFFSLCIETFYVLLNYFNSFSFTGISMNKNISAFSILIKIPFLFINDIKPFLKKHLIKIVEICSILSLFLLQSRSAILALLLIYTSIFAIKKLRKSMKYSFLFLVFIFLLNISTTDLIRDQKEFDITNILNDTSLNYRFDYYKTAYELILEKPLLGHGFGSWKYQSLKNYNFLEQNSIHIPYYVHNDLLQIFVENGLIGLFLIVFIFFYYFSKSIKLINSNSSYYLITLSLLVFIIDAFINFPMYRVQELIVFILVIGLIDYKIIIFKKINLFSSLLILLLVGTGLFFRLKHKSLIIEDTFLIDYANNSYLIDEKQLEKINYSIPSLTSKTVPVSTYVARYYINFNNLKQAEKLIDYGLSVNPYDIMTKELKLKILLEKGSYIEALNLSNDLFQNNPFNQNYAEIYFSISSNLYQVNNFLKISIYRLSNSPEVHKIFYKYYDLLPNLNQEHIKENLVNSIQMFPNDTYFQEILNKYR